MRRAERGQATLETALVLPVLLAIVLALVTLGRIYHTQQILTLASREGARLGALGAGHVAVQEAVDRCLAGGGLPLAVARVTIELHGPGSELFRVGVDYAMPLILPVPGIPDPLPLRAQTTMRREGTP